MKVTGVQLSIFNPTEDGGVYGSTPWPQVGMYSIDARTSNTRNPSIIPCPYCHERLSEIVNRSFGRIKMISKELSLKDMIPPTHMVLGCYNCHQVFTSPRDSDETS